MIPKKLHNDCRRLEKCRQYHNTSNINCRGWLTTAKEGTTNGERKTKKKEGKENKKKIENGDEKERQLELRGENDVGDHI